MTKHYIVRDGARVPVAPWFHTLSADARRIMGRIGPMPCDPKGQLGLPLPDMDSGAQRDLDFSNTPAIKKEQRYAVSERHFDELIDLQHKLQREGDKINARYLWEILATVVKA